MRRLSLVLLAIVLGAGFAGYQYRETIGGLRATIDDLSERDAAKSIALADQARVLFRQRAELEALRARLTKEESRRTWDEALQAAILDRARVAK